MLGRIGTFRYFTFHSKTFLLLLLVIVKVEIKKIHILLKMEVNFQINVVKDLVVRPLTQCFLRHPIEKLYS